MKEASTFTLWPKTIRGYLRLMLVLSLLFTIYRIGWQIPSPIFN